MNISRKIREISLLRKIANESNFFYACDKYCFLFIRVYIQERLVKHTQKSHREGNRERISSGGRCTKERGSRKAELPLFPPYFEFEIEPKRGGTRGEARNLIEV